MDSSVRHNLLLTFRNGASFLREYGRKDRDEGFFVSGNLQLEVGDNVDIEIVFADDLMVFHSRGVVHEKYAESVGERGAGLLVDFLPSEEGTRKLLLEFAQGRHRFDVRRRPRRFPIQIEIEYATDVEFSTAFTDDFNKDGAFILAHELLDSGTLVALRVKPPGGGSVIELNGEVAWRQLRPRRGFGVRFLVGDDEKQKRLVDLVERLMTTEGEEPEEQSTSN